MKFNAVSRFELLAADGNKPAGPQTVKVAANGASRIQFFAMPLDVEVAALATFGQAAYKELHRIAPRINGLALLPALIVFDYDNTPPAADRNVSAMWGAGDRLDFAHGPTTHDQTIYELTWPAGNSGQLLTSPLVMVVRTFTTQIH